MTSEEKHLRLTLGLHTHTHRNMHLDTCVILQHACTHKKKLKSIVSRNILYLSELRTVSKNVEMSEISLEKLIIFHLTTFMKEFMEMFLSLY